MKGGGTDHARIETQWSVGGFSTRREAKGAESMGFEVDVQGTESSGARPP